MSELAIRRSGRHIRDVRPPASTVYGAAALMERGGSNPADLRPFRAGDREGRFRRSVGHSPAEPPGQRNITDGPPKRCTGAARPVSPRTPRWPAVVLPRAARRDARQGPSPPDSAPAQWARENYGPMGRERIRPAGKGDSSRRCCRVQQTGRNRAGTRCIRAAARWRGVVCAAAGSGGIRHSRSSR